MSKTPSPSKPHSLSITIIGCGKMGSSMLKLWLERSLLSKVNIFEPNPIENEFLEHPYVVHNSKYNDSYIDTDFLILAVKPQILEQATSALKDNISSNCIILSIAAGKSLSSMSTIFGDKQPIIRTMPNTPAAIGEGAIVAISNQYVTSSQKDMSSSLLESLGSLYWIEDELLMDAVTALSGSGPAYLFYLIEVLSKAGEDIGLEPDLANALARQTIIGSAALAKDEPNIPANILRENVTSPRGTTQAALDVLMDGKLQEIFLNALKAAKARAKELNN